MREFLVVIAFVLFLSAVAAVGMLDPPVVMLWGQRIMLISISVALPLWGLYFFGLARHRAKLAPGWYWRSYEHHGVLRAYERWWVLGAFGLGSTFMLTSIIGIIAVVAATIRVIQQI